MGSWEAMVPTRGCSWRGLFALILIRRAVTIRWPRRFEKRSGKSFLGLTNVINGSNRGKDRDVLQGSHLRARAAFYPI